MRDMMCREKLILLVSLILLLVLLGENKTTIAAGSGNPHPTSGTTAGLTPTLSWSPSEQAASHDVYFGTSFGDVNDTARLAGDVDHSGEVDFADVQVLAEQWLKGRPEGPRPSANLNDDNDVDFFDFVIIADYWAERANAVFKGNHDSNSFNPGTLEFGKTYYWRIDEVNGPNTYKGDVWNFKSNWAANDRYASDPLTDACDSWGYATRQDVGNIYVTWDDANLYIKVKTLYRADSIVYVYLDTNPGGFTNHHGRQYWPANVQFNNNGIDYVVYAAEDNTGQLEAWSSEGQTTPDWTKDNNQDGFSYNAVGYDGVEICLPWSLIGLEPGFTCYICAIDKPFGDNGARDISPNEDNSATGSGSATIVNTMASFEPDADSNGIPDKSGRWSSAVTFAPQSWDNVAIGGGGCIRGMVIHPQEPNLIYLRTDVGGAYRWDPVNTIWIDITSGFDIDHKGFYGVQSLALYPNDPDIVYMAAGEWWENPSDILKSTDRGVTWNRSALGYAEQTVVQIRGNNRGSDFGERLAVDPNNGNILFFGSMWNGLWKSAQASAPGSWTKVNSWPVADQSYPSYGLTFVVFDPATGSPGNPTQTVYVGCDDNGVYRSTNAGSSWSKLTGSPIHSRQGRVASDGTLYVTTYDTVEKFQSGSWSDITPDAGLEPYCGIAVDPANPLRVVCATSIDGTNNPIFISTNGGSSWTQLDKTNVDYQSDVPWWGQYRWSSGTKCMDFDPHHTNKFWYAGWNGTWVTEDITASLSSWVTYEEGHEELVIISLVCPANGVPLLSAVADNSGFRHVELDSFPTESFPWEPGHTYHTTCVDVYEGDPNIVVLAGYGSVPYAIQYSSDQGLSWSVLNWDPNACLGKLAISSTDPNRIVVVPAGPTSWDPDPNPVYDRSVKYTTDGGSSWNNAAGAPNDTIFNRWSPEEPLAADKVNGNKFYLYSSGSLYRTDDGGANWSVVNSSLPVDDNHYVKTVPGVDGEIWIALDWKGLYKSSDSGANFTKLGLIQQAKLVAFGKTPPGQTHPAVFVYGVIDNYSGIFRSDDMGSNWVKISDDDIPIGNDPRTMAGDRQQFGRVFIGTDGSGIFYNNCP